MSMDLTRFFVDALRGGHFAVFASSGLQDGTPILKLRLGCTCGAHIAEHDFDARDDRANLDREIAKAVHADQEAFRLHRALMVARN